MPAIGVSASVLLHALVIQSVIWGTGGPADVARNREGLGANAIASTEEPVATLILIEEPSAGPHEEDSLQQLASHGAVLQTLRLTIVSPDSSIAAALEVDDRPDEKTTEPQDSSGDRQRLAALFGQYTGQIRARVERGWLRPRSPIGTESFDCRVQILQNKRGDVQEVALQRCNGDVRWGLSVVQAIERASPLPAPPDPAVFAETLQLSFHAAPYVAGESEEGFEPSPSRSAARINAPVLPASSTFEGAPEMRAPISSPPDSVP